MKGKKRIDKAFNCIWCKSFFQVFNRAQKPEQNIEYVKCINNFSQKRL